MNVTLGSQVARWMIHYQTLPTEFLFNCMHASRMTYSITSRILLPEVILSLYFILFYLFCFEFLNNERNSPYYLGSLWTEVDMPLGVCLDSGNVQCFLWVSYCLWNSQVLFFSKTTLKLGFTVLFTHLKIVN